MPTGRAAAGKLVILALALGALGLGTTACGGDSAAKKQAAATAARADADWRAGFVRWHRQMLGALNGMSILFSSPGPVQLLQAKDRRTDARLAAFDDTLAGCSKVLAALGPAPAELTEAQAAAKRACADLEEGARLVSAGVKAIQSGRGVSLSDRATTPLSNGQNEMDVAAREARHAPKPG